VLVYTPPKKAQLYIVVWYDGNWHECYAKAQTYKPFLEPIRTEVHVTDVAKESQPDKPTAEDSTIEEEKELNLSI